MSSEKNRKCLSLNEGVIKGFVVWNVKEFLEIVLSPVLKRMETEILEFLLSHQYINKTCCLSGVRFLSALLMSN